MRSTCEFEFDNNPSKIFYSGQKISGNIKLHLNEVKKVRGIYIVFSGEAKTEWRKKTGRGNNVAVECYFKERIYFIGGINGKLNIHLLCYKKIKKHLN